MQWLDSPQAIQLPSAEVTTLMRQALTTFVLRRSAMIAALPPLSLIATPTRSSSDLTYVLFENIDGNTQRQYIITIQEESPSSWRMIVNAAPPVVGKMLLSVGKVQSFVAHFNHTGEARFEGIPVDMIFNPDEPDLEFAVLRP
ncbi:hypothetical protein EKD04_000335 [Chloroflexales bacterium ZM16-3]|nr:hypothetical protein [Chloroflexales bacterium ZM16-3]